MQLFGVADGGGNEHVVGVEVGDRLIEAQRCFVQVCRGAAMKRASSLISGPTG